MSKQSSSTFSTSSYSYSSSSSSSTSEGVTTGSRSAQHVYTDSEGNTTVKTANQNLGEPVIQDTRHFDSSGQERVGALGSSGATTSRRIEDVSDEDQARRDREYEERMEDE
ncbi:uncharacterized protein MYCFIDRAFT_181565 [Pseudocercospora fijiensis CIRAD86]|uniref:Uncharacterized protein n=1 Tax=Pseudocercospora fijiensis (strain CIRAD86) TaxID=383855 RepID=N1Q9D1_PSEFD|nr:uncharacterized protein MYCFIDRAFT_181565 [Pseudocercospora fijiensis CIRAD86]EME89505.1 hypothetical protein MYCFIDRAFT_181565 [Pseudocercospora fijiensis CIRAD86]